MPTPARAEPAVRRPDREEAVGLGFSGFAFPPAGSDPPRGDASDEDGPRRPSRGLAPWADSSSRLPSQLLDSFPSPPASASPRTPSLPERAGPPPLAPGSPVPTISLSPSQSESGTTTPPELGGQEPAADRRPSLRTPGARRRRPWSPSPPVPVSDLFDPLEPPPMPLPPLPALPPLPGSGKGLGPSAFDPSSPPRLPLPPLPPPSLPASRDIPVSPRPTESQRASSTDRHDAIPSPTLPSPSVPDHPSSAPGTDTADADRDDARSPEPPSPVGFDAILSSPLPKRRLSHRTSYLPLSPRASLPLSPRASLRPPEGDDDDGEDDDDASAESEIDLEASLEALAWRAGVMGRFFGAGGGVGEDGERRPRREARECTTPTLEQVPLPAPVSLSPRTTRPYKVARRPSADPVESESSSDEELFDLSFDSTSTASTAGTSVRSSRLSRSRCSTNPSSASSSSSSSQRGPRVGADCLLLSPTATAPDLAAGRKSWHGIEATPRRVPAWRASSLSAPDESAKSPLQSPTSIPKALRLPRPHLTSPPSRSRELSPTRSRSRVANPPSRLPSPTTTTTTTATSAALSPNSSSGALHRGIASSASFTSSLRRLSVTSAASSTSSRSRSFSPPPALLPPLPLARLPLTGIKPASTRGAIASLQYVGGPGGPTVKPLQTAQAAGTSRLPVPGTPGPRASGVPRKASIPPPSGRP